MKVKLEIDLEKLWDLWTEMTKAIIQTDDKSIYYMKKFIKEWKGS